MTAHMLTTGRWEIDEAHRHNSVIDGDAPVLAEEFGFPIVAAISIATGRQLRRRFNPSDNLCSGVAWASREHASLIAAAPDMYEALVLILDGDGSEKQMAVFFKAARAALARVSREAIQPADECPFCETSAGEAIPERDANLIAPQRDANDPPFFGTSR